MIDPLPRAVPSGWTVSSDEGTHRALRCDRGGDILEVIVRRCIDGPLRDAYPVSLHDVELSPTDVTGRWGFSAELSELAQAILDANPRCRRVVFAAPADDQKAMAAVQAAGFRHVIDVDVAGADLSLLVAEPNWLAQADSHLDLVPDV